MRRLRWLLLAGLLLLLVLWCRNRGQFGSQTHRSSALQRQLVDAWLECEECVAGELDSVVSIGREVAPVFGEYLLHGPPPERIAALRNDLTRSYRRLTIYVSHDTLAPRLVSESAYVETFVANYDATYRSRSAKALGRIGGRTAKAALDSALELHQRPDVHAQVQCARDPACSAP